MSGTNANAGIEAAARKWVVYLHSGETNPQRLMDFETWLKASPDHARAYRDHEQLMGDLGLVQAIMTIDAHSREPVTLRRTRRFAPAWLAPAGGAIAAGVACLALVGLWNTPPHSRHQMPAVQTHVAEIRNVVLPDGTQVTLGARTRIETRFTDEMRLVTLSEGEAYFEVTSDKSRPFYVAAGDRLVRVVGTRFDVRHGAEEIKVSVVEGVVEVLQGQDASQAEQDRPFLAKDVLRAGDQVVAAIGAPHVARFAIEPREAAAWRLGRLSYENASLAEIVADANRYHVNQIELASDALGDIRITAAFDKDQIDQFIAGLEATQPLSADRSAPGRILLRPDN